MTFRIKIAVFCLLLCCSMERVDAFQSSAGVTSGDTTDTDIPFDNMNMPEVLPGTQPLTWQIHLSDTMMQGAHKLIDGKIEASADSRPKLWNRDFSSHEAYEQSVEPNRRRFMEYIGLRDSDDKPAGYNVGLPDEHPPVVMQKFAINGDSVLVAETAKYRVYQVRWPVLNRVAGEGLLLQPKTSPVANTIAIPDADHSPEQLAGLSPGIPAESQFARRLAENGFRVLVPVLVDRSEFSTEGGDTQTHREWIYRQAFHIGRHIIGYEVQKVLAAVEWFRESAGGSLKIGVAGYGEGGLVAFYAAAVDTGIDAAFVSGYFESRQQVWEEPIYRNVWGLLTEFGDAEIASLIAPRPLVVEHSALPKKVEKATEKPPGNDTTSSYTGYKGSLQTPLFEDVQSEFSRIDEVTAPGFQPRHLFSGPDNEAVGVGSQKALEQFARFLDYDASLPVSDEIPVDNRTSFSPEQRQLAQIKEMEDHVQWLLRDSDQTRNDFFLHQAMPEFAEKRWSTKRYHRYYSPDRFIDEARAYRAYFWEKILGKFEESRAPANARTRKVYDENRWTGYEVVLDVYEGFVAPGILLIPKDIEPGEKRPVVVAQHGRNGVPKDLIEGSTSYYDIAAKLADRGFIVFAPNGLFRGEDRYRWLDRKANAVKKTLFSFIIAQHEQILQWLGSLAFVDPDRIAFYGKSYGGETAMRVPAVLEGYSLSICSADFGDWSRKVMDTHFPYSFMNTIEWEMFYFNMGSTFSYAEMAYLIFPRPFMVERGRHDLVQPDEWVAYEYEKVRHFYEQFNLADRTEIEFFNGGHASRNEGTFEFLHKHLDWP